MISVIIRVKDEFGKYVEGVTVEFSHQPFCEAVWSGNEKTNEHGDVRFMIPSDDQDRETLRRIEEKYGMRT